MPRSVNGCGTMYYGRACPIYWRKPEVLSNDRPDYDTIVCATVLFLPLFPIKACHVFDWNGETCREIPLRWNMSLFARTLLRNVLMICLGIGVLACIPVLGMTVTSLIWPGTTPVGKLFVAVPIVVLPTLLLLVLYRWIGASEVRDRDIRLLIGPHDLGSSDPATWQASSQSLSDGQVQFQSEEALRKAFEEALEAGNWGRAMFLARLVVFKGDVNLGEEMTDRILRDLRVLGFIEELRKEPWRRDEWVTPVLQDAKPGPYDQQSASQPESDSLIQFYDNRFYSAADLDAAGGKGYADFVRAHPALDLPARSPWYVFAVLGLGIIGFLCGGLVEVFSPNAKDPLGLLLGMGIFCSLLGYTVYEAWSRRVQLGEGRLWVGGWRGQAVLLDAVSSTKRRRWIGIIPVVAVHSLAEEIDWPIISTEEDDVERSIKAAIVLRNREANNQESSTQKC